MTLLETRKMAIAVRTARARIEPRAAMNARSTAASDWVDYSLDQQTVMGPNGIAKVSSTPTHVWSSTVGNDTYYYGTSDTNANPNGVLPGNWVENQKVHGNGQSY